MDKIKSEPFAIPQVQVWVYPPGKGRHLTVIKNKVEHRIHLSQSEYYRFMSWLDRTTGAR